MWFPFAADLPCLHCEAVQSTWSYMSVCVSPFWALHWQPDDFSPGYHSFWIQFFPFLPFLVLLIVHIWFSRLASNCLKPQVWSLPGRGSQLVCRLVWRNLLQCRHLHISRHNDMPLPSRATTYNALCWKQPENLSVGVWRLLEQQPTRSNKTQPPSLLSFPDQHPTGMPKQFPLQVATPPSGRLPQCNGENKISLLWFIKVAFYDHHHNWNLRCFWNRTKYSGWLNILLFIQHQAFAQQWMNTNSQATYSANIKLEISIQISLAKHTEQSIKYNRVGLFSWAVLCGSCRLGKVRPGHDEWLMNSPPIATAVIEQNTEQNNNRIKTRKVINIQTHIWWWHWRRRRLTKRQDLQKDKTLYLSKAGGSRI